MFRKPSSRRCFHNYQNLEPRQMLASIGFESGKVLVRGNATADVIELVGNADFQGFMVRINSDTDLTENFAYADVTKLTVIAGGGNDRVTNTLLRDSLIYGGDGNDFIEGGYRNDQLFGGDGFDTMIGRNGDDTLRGQGGNDLMFGGNGADRLFGFDGNDRAFGGPGNDFLRGDAGNDLLRGEEGIDRLLGGADNDRLFGGADNDRIFGEAGNDQIVGENGNDLLIGGLGDDRMVGNAGDDLLNGNEGDDTIHAGIGDDTVNGGLGDDAIFSVDGTNNLNGNGGNDRIFGGNGEDKIDGGSGNDRLAGGQGEDRLQGGNGVDVLFGGPDNDDLGGGDGNDFLYGQQGDDFLLGDDGADNVFGNDGNDRFFLWGNTDRFGDRVNGGTGVDEVATVSTQYDFRLDRVGSNIRFTDLRLPSSYLWDGQATLTSIEQVNLAGAPEDGPLPIESLLWKPIVERAIVQPIIVSDDDGSNTATAFGTAEQEAEIKRRVDRIYNQAGVDIEWLPAKQWNDTFANGVGEGVREGSELIEIFNRGDAAGVGSPDPLVLDYYFVSRVPGSASPTSSNGVAFIRQNKATQASYEFLPDVEHGRDTIADVFAHEIGHNFGLRHTESPTLMSEGIESKLLIDSQITQVIGSRFTRPI